MHIQVMQEYVLLCEKLNYTEAANYLYISQSTLSKHIADLEKELGVKLLVRDKHTTVPTDIGKIVCDHFKNILREYDAMEKRMQTYQMSVSSRFRFGSLYYFVEEYAHPILMALSEKKPNILPQLSYYQPLPLINALEADSIDIAVTYHYAYSGMNDYCFVDFTKENAVLAVGKNSPLSSKDSIDLKTLKNETFVVLRSQPYLDHILKILKRYGISDPKLSYCDQIDALDLTINKVGGISIMPNSIKNMSRKNISLIPISSKEPLFTVCALYKKTNQNAAIPLILSIIESQYQRL